MRQREPIKELGDWKCDLRVAGEYKGQRVATKFRPGTFEVEAEAEWCRVDELGEPFPEEDQGLLVSTKRITGTVVVPRGVVEWLRGSSWC